MDTRRDFLKKATLLSGALGLNSLIPAAVQKALAIEATPGTTWLDAEHIVILMQENRSFDHTYGTLQGVRGFNDPRAIQLPNQNPVWLQSNAAGETYSPFRLDLKNTKATWMNSLPHSWQNQVNARNDGKYDQWLIEKRNSIHEYADIPLTLGYHTREDIPFYYALADAFTVCDQHFCSALTGTSPNRLFFWTGSVRAEQDENSRAHVWNEDMDYETLKWKTFPELLEEHEVSWKFYQNEVSIDVGFEDDQDPWLSNFQDNPLEFFSQYNIRLHGKHLAYLESQMDQLPKEIADLQTKLNTLPASDSSAVEMGKLLTEKKSKLAEAIKEIREYNREKYASLSEKDKSLHHKAFVTNANDPDYHSLESVNYDDNGTARSLNVPKGDLLHQFREDVTSGNLPTVSWIAAPENLSDHPASAWYGAWYISEVMDILTQNPEVWKKTIFILTYDENDGYFDHIPPFVAPHSDKPETGRVSTGIDTRVEFVTHAQEQERKGFPKPFDRESPIGLGYRVPLLVASPWSRGGYINSEVFDHTSTLQFLETFVSNKKNRPIREQNISNWRRTVCGNLTSVFRNPADEPLPDLAFISKKPFLESIYNAKFKQLPSDYKALMPDEIASFKINPFNSPFMAIQEKGVRPSCALPYQLYVGGQLNMDKNTFDIRFESSSEMFGDLAMGSPFNVYAPGNYLQEGNGESMFVSVRTWAYTVKSSDTLHGSWSLKDFQNQLYHLRVYGPNGFFREFMGTAEDPPLEIQCNYQHGMSGKKLSGNIDLSINNRGSNAVEILITDNAYKTPFIRKTVSVSSSTVPIDLSKQFGWYDFTVEVIGSDLFKQRFAGRVETGRHGFTDPYMGQMI